LDDELADGYAILGSLAARHEFDWITAERHLRHALQLNPNSALAHFQLAQNVLAPQGRWQEAHAENRLATELDPLSPVILDSEPWLMFLEGRHDEALDGFRRRVAETHGEPNASGGLAAVLAAKGQYAEALEILRAAPFQHPLTRAEIGQNLAQMGKAAEARKILDHLLMESKRHFISPVAFAFLYMGLGDADNVFRYFEMARDQQESILIFLRSRTLVSLRYGSDPRFVKLLAEVGLSDEQVARYQSVALSGHR
jgi:tetratricopeptide (TPR) repeat protein